MTKRWLKSQNSLKKTCNGFFFTFIKHLFKLRDVLHIGCLLEKVINHTVLIRTIALQLIHITWKVIAILEFYTFPGYKNIKRLYGAMTQWIRCWIPNPGILYTKQLSGSKEDSAFHLSEKPDTRVPGISENLVGKVNCLLKVALPAMSQWNPTINTFTQY